MIRYLIVFILFANSGAIGQNIPARGFKNPVIPGFYPDPSVCRVGNDYYLVTSSFEYFPGVPVFHSRDLIHWRQIGHCLTRPSQLPLHKARSSGGIYAPTIRYHNGTFYMTTTNTTDGGNFYVTTTDPAGEWSEPVFVDQPGIDPSLLFDDDGKVYFQSNGGGEVNGIYQCEIDVKTGKRLTPPRLIWTGTGGRYPEAPHLYRIGDWYYLMIAEGGTEYGHMVTISRSKNPYGPFESYNRNPILTHRNQPTQSSRVQGTGHADLIQAHDGSWWMVFLAFRAVDGNWHHLGRETFLAPVSWTTDRWPVVDQKVIADTPAGVPTLPLHPLEEAPGKTEFDEQILGHEWNYLRNPSPEDYSLADRKGWLRLMGSSLSLSDADAPAFLGRRQQHFDFEAITLLDFNPALKGEEAGLTVLMNESHHYEVCVRHDGKNRVLVVKKKIGSLEATSFSSPLAAGRVKLRISADEKNYYFSWAQGNEPFKDAGKADTRYLSSEVAGGFTGVYIGLYATGNGRRSTSPADFDWFSYEGK